MPEVEERKEVENDIAPVEEEQDEQGGHSRGELDISPKKIARAAFAQFLANGGGIVAEKTQKHIGPRILGFAIMTVAIDRQPIDGFAVFVLPIGIALVMLHVNGVVIGLREATSDRLGNAKEAVQYWGAEKWIVNEVVADAIDVGIDHQRIDEPEDEHDPEWRNREQKEESEEVGQMEKTGQSRDRIPTGVREQLRVRHRPFYSDGVAIH